MRPWFRIDDDTGVIIGNNDKLEIMKKEFCVKKDNANDHMIFCKKNIDTDIKSACSLTLLEHVKVRSFFQDIYANVSTLSKKCI